MTTTTTKKATTQKTILEDLPANPFIFEVFNLVSKQRSNVKKIELLNKYTHPAIKSLFIWNFDESAVMAVVDRC